MAEFKDSIPHTGGIITIRKRGQQYSLGYRHVGMHAASVVQLLAVDGRAAAVIPVGGLSLRDDPPPPQLRVLVPSDRHGMFGRQCPKCKSYFRTETATTELCPYCDHSALGLDFLTDYQRESVKSQSERHQRRRSRFPASHVQPPSSVFPPRRQGRSGISGPHTRFDGSTKRSRHGQEQGSTAAAGAGSPSRGELPRRLRFDFMSEAGSSVAHEFS